MRRVILFLLLTCPLPALAGGNDWCLVINAVEQCRFISADECYRDTDSIRGSCRMNFKKLGDGTEDPGESRYCLVTSHSRVCAYRGKASCLTAAVKVKGGCVENVNLYMDKARSRRFGFDDFGIEGELEDLRQAQKAARRQ
jgi:hypothetical protein